MKNFNKEDLLKILEELLMIYSPSRNEKALALYIIKFLDNLGAEFILISHMIFMEEMRQVFLQKLKARKKERV
ncbi:MAG: hypothetical protein PUG67_09040 [Peptoniphilaceae bacterium]|nr:hypothetical protein [Peptoniphilaceae bacterium]MDY6018533.1 hypothetical protein [Anaerococcus sp.]